jgi:hypothetical protein
MSFICQFCNKEFSAKGNMNNHQKTAKYCLSKRGFEKLQLIENQIKCQYCPKLFTSKQMCRFHEEKCNNKTVLQVEKDYKLKLDEKDNLLRLRDQEILFLKNQVRELQSNITSIALEGVKKPTTTNTNNTSNSITNILVPLDLDEDKIQDIVENRFNETHFLDAQKGVAKFCFENLIKTEDGKRRMVCSDPVRERYRYIDEKGDIKEDLQARQFIEKISKPIIDASGKLYDEIREKYSQIKENIEKGIEKGISDYIVEIKEKHAEQCFIDIHDLPYESRNKKFRKEFAVKANI